jgi:hypothetical protein
MVTVTLDIHGPGEIAIAGAVQLRCSEPCVVEAPKGSTVTMEALPRAGARVSSFGTPCGGNASCTLSAERATFIAATFEWLPLPPTTGYVWKRIDRIAMFFADIDSAANAVGVDYEEGPYHAIRYDAALETLDRLPGAPDCIATHVNDDGVVVLEGAWRWENGSATRLIDPEGAALQAWDLSERGWIVGARFKTQHDYEPWVYDGTSLEVWGNVTAPTVASAVNTAGQVVGTRAVHETFPTGKAWVGRSVLIREEATELLAIPEPSYAHDLSETGLVVGTLSSIGPRARGYVYDLSTRELRVLEPIANDIALLLTRIDPAGRVAVGDRMLADGASGAAVYFVEEDRLVALDTLVELPPGCALLGAGDVNVFGQILASAGCSGEPSGDYNAQFLLTPE